MNKIVNGHISTRLAMMITIFVTVISIASSVFAEPFLYDTTKLTPKIIAAPEWAMPTVMAGTTTEITVPILNNSSYKATKISISPQLSGEDKFPIEVERLIYTELIDKIEKEGGRGEVTFKFKIKPTAIEGVYPIELKMEYENEFQDTFSSSDKIYIKVQNTNTVPRLIISNTSTSSGIVKQGQQFNLDIKIQNLGSMDAKDVKVYLKGLKSDGIFHFGTADLKYIPQIKGRESQNITYTLQSSNDISEGNHELGLKIEYVDALNKVYTEESQVFLPVKEDKDAKERSPFISFANVAAPTGKMGINEDFTVAMDVKNTGGGTARNVKIVLASDKEIIPKTLGTQAIPKLEKGQSHRISFTLSATSEAVTKNYPIAINVEYEEIDKDKTLKHNAVQYVGAYVENLEKQNEGKNSKSVPKIILQQYSVDPSDVKAGQNVQVSMVFLNTSRTRAVENIKINLVSEDGTFTAVNGSNTIYIEKVEPQGIMNRTVTLNVKPDAAAKVYPLSVNFEYEDTTGNPFTAKESISIPVNQPLRLTLGQVNVSPEVFVGQPFAIDLEFYNMGKSTVSNLMIKLEGEFKSENSSMYVGNMEAGKSEIFDATIIPDKAGEAKGKVVFTFEDQSGKPMEMVKEVTFNAVERAAFGGEGPEAVMGQKASQEKKINPVLVIVSSIALLAAVIIVFYKKKIRAKKGMEIDEEF